MSLSACPIALTRLHLHKPPYNTNPLLLLHHSILLSLILYHQLASLYQNYLNIFLYFHNFYLIHLAYLSDLSLNHQKIISYMTLKYVDVYVGSTQFFGVYDLFQTVMVVLWKLGKKLDSVYAIPCFAWGLTACLHI